MKPRSCSHLHFIQAIRVGLVEKIRNVDSRGRPVLVFKKLEDIYKNENAKKVDRLQKLRSQDRYADMVLDCDRETTESPCKPLIGGKTKKRDINTIEFNCNLAEKEKDSESDHIDFGKMTLKQLKDQCKSKKKKVSHFACSSPEQDYTCWKQKDDECDLMEPISNWKSKLSKNLKGRRKRVKECVSTSSNTEFSGKSEDIPCAEDSLQSGGSLPAFSNIKVEFSETDYSECRNMIGIAGDTSTGCSDLLGLCIFAEILQVAKPEFGSGEPVSLAEECQSCVADEISYCCLNHIESDCLLPSNGGENTDAENLRRTYQPFMDLPAPEDEGEGYIRHPVLEESNTEKISPVWDEGSDMCKNFKSSSFVHDISKHTSKISFVQVPDVAMDGSLCWMELSSADDPCKFDSEITKNLPPNLETDSSSSTLSNCSSSWNSTPRLSQDIVLVSVEEDPPSTEKPLEMSPSGDVARNCSPHKSSVAYDGDSIPVEEKRPLRSFSIDVESNSPHKNRHCDAVDEDSVPEPKNYHHVEHFHHPERLLSTRKAISPTSQEKLWQAMQGTDLTEERGHYKCKAKLQFGKQIKSKASSLGTGTERAEVNTNTEGLVEIDRTKVTKKQKSDRIGSPPKGIRRVPQLSRSLPRVNSDVISIQSCSERAIAFSQRQMQDVECLAVKLMRELKSMKNIVEGELHSKASPTTFFNFDVDEVKTAIENATKLEETTRKWLSMMARDCNRFCKLMRTTEKGEINAGTANHKVRKKITFADEAGGVLCHVKFFEDNMASLDSRS